MLDNARTSPVDPLIEFIILSLFHISPLYIIDCPIYGSDMSTSSNSVRYFIVVIGVTSVFLLSQ